MKRAAVEEEKFRSSSLFASRSAGLLCRVWIGLSVVLILFIILSLLLYHLVCWLIYWLSLYSIFVFEFIIDWLSRHARPPPSWQMPFKFPYFFEHSPNKLNIGPRSYLINISRILVNESRSAGGPEITLNWSKFSQCLEPIETTIWWSYCWQNDNYLISVWTTCTRLLLYFLFPAENRAG